MSIEYRFNNCLINIFVTHDFKQQLKLVFCNFAKLNIIDNKFCRIIQIKITLSIFSRDLFETFIKYFVTIFLVVF